MLKSLPIFLAIREDQQPMTARKIVFYEHFFNILTNLVPSALKFRDNLNTMLMFAEKELENGYSFIEANRRILKQP